MKVRVGDRGVPADHHVVADAQLQLAEEDGVREVAIIADLQPPLLAESEVGSVQRAVRANHQGRVAPAAEALERDIPGDHAAVADADIRRQRAVQPAAGA